MNTDNILSQLFCDIKRTTPTEQAIFQNIICDILSDKDVLLLINHKHHKGTNRLIHSLRVSYRCFIVCYRHNLDYKSAAIGGLLHDFCLDDKGKYKRDSFRDIWCLYHPVVALQEAEKRFPLSDKSKDMIKNHMFPVCLSIPRHTETLLICYWDKHYAIKEVFKRKERIAQ